MKTISLVLLILCIASAVIYAKDFVTATDIQKVNLGDTFEQVSKKIGEPQQVLSKELSDDGKEKVIWLYETVKRPKIGGIIHSTADDEMTAQTIYQQQLANNPPYLIIFINGKTAIIKRQKIESIPTAQVNVSSY